MTFYTLCLQVLPFCHLQDSIFLSRQSGTVLGEQQGLLDAVLDVTVLEELTWRGPDGSLLENLRGDVHLSVPHFSLLSNAH